MWFCILTLIVFGYLQDGIRCNPLAAGDNGYVYTAGIGYHKIHSTAKTWNTARSICQDEGGDLAVIDSYQESEVIIDLFTRSLPHSGSYDSNYALVRLRTNEVDSSEQETNEGQGWDEPSSTESYIENCESIDQSGQLNSISCNQSYAFVCERSEHKKESEVCGKVVRMNVTVAKELIIEGAKVSITCDVVDYPASRVLWYKDDDLIQTNDRIDISGANELIIRSANKDDTGKYRCEAAAKSLSGAHTVDIKVMSPIKATIAMGKGPILKGSRFSISCHVDGYPTPKVLWYKDNTPIQTSNRIRISANELIISDADNKDTGRYRCEAANEFTSSAETVDIKVAEPIKVTIAVGKGPFLKGSQFTISCHVDGYPTPKVLWYKDNARIQTSNRIKISANDLIISAADNKDTGRYRCEAANEYTSSAETVDIRVAEPVKVKISVDRGLLSTGSEISIVCNVDGYPTPTLQWYKDDNLIRKTERVNILANKLIISTAEKNDAGKYRCEASNEYTSSAETVDIKVAEPIKVTIAVGKGPFLKGSQFTISCHVDGYPTPKVLWYKDNVRIQTSNRIKISANDLIISAADNKDTGRYRCEAANEYTSSAETVDIKVAMPVKIKISAESGLFPKGSEISIVCNADGYPTPTVQWYKDDNLVRKTERINILANKLIISTAEENDAGRYRCEASNEDTSSAETVDIKVAEPIKVTTAVSRGPYLKGSQFSISCHVDGYPTPRVFWYKDNVRIQTNNKITITANKLIISAADNEDTGKYRCEAANEYSSSAGTVDIKVVVPVKVKISVESGLVSTGREIRIACNADGYPTPTVNWYKDGNLIKKTERINIVANKLIISTAEKNDSGKYRCAASNEYTSSAETADIKVTNPPNVKTTIKKGPFFAGNEISIACNVDSGPILMVNWYKDGNPIQTNNRISISPSNTLIISNATREDTGTYRCVAANDFTIVAASVDVEVHDPIKVTITANPDRSVFGNKITLTCNAVGYPTPRITWHKDGSPIRTNNRMKIVANSLVISTIQMNDIGTYSCNATNGYTSGVGTANITNIVPPKVKMTIKEGPFSSGSQISMACNVDGYPTAIVNWYKNGNPIHTNNRIAISPSNTLIIASATRDDTGTYRCVVADEFIKTEASGYVEVHDPIKVTITANPDRFVFGNKITLTCNAVGYPTPRITWHKDGSPIRTNNRINIVANSLMISIIQMNDIGTYSCNATNEYTSGVGTATIKNIIPPQVKMTIKEGPFSPGSQISMACNVDGYPTAVVNWYKDGKPMQTNNRIAISPSNTLTISSATSDDTGTYRCVAADGLTRTEASGYVKVRDPIKVTITANPNGFIFGNKITLTCNAVGYPIPRITWHKDGSPIRTNNRIKIVGNNLMISPIQLYDAGLYSCNATNGYTNGVGTANVRNIGISY